MLKNMDRSRYKKSFEKHNKCVRVMYFREFEKLHIFPEQRAFSSRHCVTIPNHAENKL
jgi:hypothetical protein